MSFGRALSRRRVAMGPASGRRPLRRLRVRLAPKHLWRVAAAVVCLGPALFGGWLWLRDSSLVAVEHVTVTGQSGADAAAIRSALTSAARKMTTLDVQMGQLRSALAPFPEVKGLRVTTQFPHGIRIQVLDERPVGAVQVGGGEVAVAQDGIILRDVTAKSLPSIPQSAPPTGRRLTAPSAVAAVALLGAAPYQLLPRISAITTVAGEGLAAQVRSGPSIYLGDARQARAKWLAALAVLRDPSSVGATYIDVTDPMRPVAGSGTGAASPAAGSSGTAASPTDGASGTSGTPSGG